MRVPPGVGKFKLCISGEILAVIVIGLPANSSIEFVEIPIFTSGLFITRVKGVELLGLKFPSP